MDIVYRMSAIAATMTYMVTKEDGDIKTKKGSYICNSGLILGAQLSNSCNMRDDGSCRWWCRRLTSFVNIVYRRTRGRLFLAK